MPTEIATSEVAERVTSRFEDWVITAGLVIVTIVGYANSLDGEFVYDDETAIVENPAVRALWHPASGRNSERPLAIWTFAVNYAYGGLEPNSYHVVNLVIHAVGGVMLWLLGRRLLATRYFGSRISANSSRLAAVIAVLWLAHPINTQGVTYVVQRMESLASIFILIALYAIARSEGRWSAWWCVAAVASVFGMWTKPIVLTLPVLGILVDRVVCHSDIHQFGRRAAMFALLSACVLGANGTYLFNAAKAIQPTQGQTQQADRQEAESANGQLEGFTAPKVAELKQRPSAWEYVRTQPEILLHYARLVVWPSGLTLDYAWPIQQNVAISLGLGAVITVLVGVSIYLAWTSPGWGLLAMWPWVLLGPTSSFLPIQDLAYEHRMYLAVSGPIALIVLFAYSRLEDRVGSNLLAVTAGCVTLIFLALTIDRNRDYYSVERMWAETVRTAPWNARAWNNLAFLKLEAGDDKAAASAFARARQIDTTPIRRIYILHNEAFARYNLGEYEQTVALANEAEAIAGGTYALPHFLRGSVKFKEGNYAAAVAELDRSIELEPDFIGAYFIRGQTNVMLGYNAAAAKDFETLLQSDPDRHEAIVNYAIALSRMGQTAQAIQQFSRAITMTPQDWPLYADRGLLLQKQQQYEAAIADFETVLRNAPQLSPAWQGMIATLVDAEQWETAERVRSQFEQLGGTIPDDVRERLEQATR